MRTSRDSRHLRNHRTATEPAVIAVVEDELSLCRLLGEQISAAGYTTLLARGERDLSQLLATTSVELITLDINLDGVRSKGLDLARSIRTERNIPIIAITALGEPLDRLRGLEAGIDDYVTKPFLMEEILLRIGRLLKIYGQAPGEPKSREDAQYSFRGYVLDQMLREVSSERGRIDLTETEFQLLSLLVMAPGRILSREELWASLRGTNRSPLDRTLDVHIARLRRKLEPGSDRPELIKSVRGIGYVLTSDVTQVRP